MSFTTRILLASTSLVVVALAAAAAITYTRGNRIATHAVNDALTHSRAVQQSFQTLRFQQLRLMSRLLATDPYFISYVANATGNNLTGAGEVDTRSILDLLTEREGELGFDFGIVLDGNGHLLAGTGGMQSAQQDMTGVPAIAAALQSQSASTGYWIRDGRAYQIAVAPLANRDEFLGYLVLALKIDQGLLQQVKQVSGAEVAVLDTGGGGVVPVATTLDGPQLDALKQALSNLKDVPSGKTFPLELSGERWLAYADILGSTNHVGLALALTSYDSAMGDFRAILTEQLIAAVVAALVAIALSLWLSPRLARPLRELAVAAQAAARGEFKRRFVPHGDGEIAQLTQAFDSLLSDLREKSEIENYMADLAKYLPDPSADQSTSPAELMRPNQSATTAVLGIELRDNASMQSASSEKAIDLYNQFLRNVEAPARAQGGHIAAVAGGRVYIVFDAFDAATSLVRALGTATHVRTVAGNQGLALCLALSVGNVITGAAEWTLGAAGCLVGEPVRQLEKLLPEATPGVILITAQVERLLANRPGVKIEQLPGAASGRNVFTVEHAEQIDAPHGDEDATVMAATPLADVETARAHLLPGMTLGGRYEILSELGAGGMAVVYKARDRQLGEFIALKTLKADMAGNRMLLDALKSEIRLARKITHRNVLRTYDFGEIDNIPFISMEYVRGMTLRYLLQNREQLPVAAGLRIMRQVCTALQVAHEQSVLHRDIKPENVMLEPSGNAKLMDFGIASAIRRGDGQEREKTLVGTPRYAPPEQLLGQPVDERADIYACGVMMYQIFTGKLPFNDRDMGRQSELKSKEEYVRPSELVPNISREVEAVIVACLKADRELRPRSAEVLLAMLEGIRV
ncbi:MAG TPA: protein kinase [Gammaproteobacteria bacterium]|jgi:serine/threonine-protein kinase|nr:protein kinase [Gammaproteobacteria bacterium]